MSNSVSRSYPKNNQDSLLREEIIKNPDLINAWSARLAEQVPFCPCPPETVKPALDTVDGGIFMPSVPVCECGSTFYRDDLGSCYDCFFPSDDRGE